MNQQKYEKHLRKGMALFDRKKYREAIEEYQTAIRYNERDAAARINLARCYVLTGQLYGAKRALTAMAPHVGGRKVTGAYYRLWAYIAGEEKRYDAALACLKLSQRVSWTFKGFQEKRWARSQFHGKVGWKDVVPLMKSYGIPVVFSFA